MVDLIQEISSSIKPIRRDKCVLPTKMSEELAEEFGIHMGDGHMGFRKYAVNTVYEYSIWSDADEMDYVNIVIRPLMKKLYRLEVKLYKDKRSKTLGLNYKSKSLFRFKKALGLPVGKKIDCGIPSVILTSGFVCNFLRGFFDTDGSLQFRDRNKFAPPYPRFDLSNSNERLMKQINEILLTFGFTTSFVKDERQHYKTGTLCTQFRIFLYGKKNLKKWVELIGFSNPKNINKFEEWKSKYSINF